MKSPRAHRMLVGTYAAAPLTGAAAMLAALRHPTAALVAALVAAALVISALVWAIKEVRR